MNFFDGIKKEFEKSLEGLSTVFYADATPFRDVGRNQFIMQRDCLCEPGGTGFNIITASPIEKSGVVLCGKNLDALRGECPYARVSVIEIDEISDEQKLYDTIRKIEFSKYHCFPDGFMTRAESDSLTERVRVSRRAVEEGLRFENAGSLLVEKYKENPVVKNAVVYYITSPQYDFSSVACLAKKSKEILDALNHIMKNINLDCSVCALKPVCDEVEGLRELHFGKGM